MEGHQAECRRRGDSNEKKDKAACAGTAIGERGSSPVGECRAEQKDTRSSECDAAWLSVTDNKQTDSQEGLCKRTTPSEGHGYRN
jgi:hypothetical protein